MLMNHLAAVHHAIDAGIVTEPEQIRRDVAEFFELPIPQAVWKSLRRFQDQRFARFVEESAQGLR